VKLLYTNDDQLLVGHIRNVVESAGFDVCLKNEILSSAAGGGASPLDVWVEVWVVHDNDYGEAMKVVENTLSADDGQEWECSNCKEPNGASFMLCWNCQVEKPQIQNSLMI
jgi:hypothetical protein